jgi:hypothetical protein
VLRVEGGSDRVFAIRAGVWDGPAAILTEECLAAGVAVATEVVYRDAADLALPPPRRVRPDPFAVPPAVLADTAEIVRGLHPATMAAKADTLSATLTFRDDSALRRGVAVARTMLACHAADGTGLVPIAAENTSAAGKGGARCVS